MASSAVFFSSGNRYVGGHGYTTLPGGSGGDAAPPPAPAWAPTDLTNLTAWYDLQDATKITVTSGQVETLTDKSTAGNNATQGTSTLRPQYNATGINGHPSMYNATVGDHLAAASDLLRIPSSIFMVVQYEGDDSNGAILDVLGNAYGGFYVITAFVYADHLITGTLQSTTGVSLSTGAIVEIDYSVTNGQSKMYIDNVALTLGTNTAFAAGVQAGYNRLMGGTGNVRDYKR